MSEVSETRNLPKVRHTELGPASISLVCLFQIVTACCVFFACLAVSPLLAIVGTIIAAPAIIRTGVDSELHRKNGLQFDWARRLQSFVVSLVVVLASYGVAAAVCALISMAFGAAWVCVTIIVGSKDLLPDMAFIGTAGGMIWGMFGGFFAIGICHSRWRPTLPEESK